MRVDRIISARVNVDAGGVGNIAGNANGGGGTISAGNGLAPPVRLTIAGGVGNRVRMVEYPPGYLADHRCVKGHILLCTEGEFHTELKDGRKFTLKSGMSYQVADNVETHRSHTEIGAKLFVVD